MPSAFTYRVSATRAIVFALLAVLAGAAVFEIRSAGAVYLCRSCRGGDSADLYYLIFRDGALWTVVRDRRFTHYSAWSRPLSSPEYLWRRATELVHSPDVPAPPNRPK